MELLQSNTKPSQVKLYTAYTLCCVLRYFVVLNSISWWFNQIILFTHEQLISCSWIENSSLAIHSTLVICGWSLHWFLCFFYKIVRVTAHHSHVEVFACVRHLRFGFLLVRWAQCWQFAKLSVHMETKILRQPLFGAKQVIRWSQWDKDGIWLIHH